MGREIKRVAAHFDWPIDKIWNGFRMPQELWPIPCKTCDETGHNKETKQIADDFYDFEHTGRRWCDKITQDEVEALVAKHRLVELTDIFIKGKGWQPKEPAYMPTAEEVNRAQAGSFLSGVHHDAINRWILIETRAKRLGVYGNCPPCGGEGFGWRNNAHKKAHDAWKETPVPSGDWWQVWETVSEGSPVTPAFATADELIDYLVAKGDAWDQQRGDGGWERANAENFVKAGWAPSLTLGPEGFKQPRDGQL